MQSGGQSALLLSRQSAESNYSSGKILLEKMKNACAAGLSGRKLANSQFFLSKKYIELRRARNLSIETEDEDRAIDAAHSTKRILSEINSLSPEKIGNYEDGKDSLLRFAFRQKFGNGRIQAIEKFFADFMPERSELLVLPEGSQPADKPRIYRDYDDADTRYLDMGVFMGKEQVGAIDIRDVRESVRGEMGSISVRNTSFQPFEPSGWPGTVPISSVLVSGIRIKGQGGAQKKSVDNFGVSTEYLGLYLGQDLLSEYDPVKCAYSFRFLDMFAVGLEGGRVRKAEGGPLSHLRRMAAQCGYDFDRFMQDLKNGIPLNFPENSNMVPAVLSADLGIFPPESFTFSIAAVFHEGKPVISTEAEIKLINSDNEIWTVGLWFPQKNLFVRQWGKDESTRAFYLNTYWTLAKERFGADSGAEYGHSEE